MPWRASGRLGTALLAGAIVLPGLILAVDGYIAWRQTWHEAEGTVTRTADSAAEYAVRVFEGHKLRLGRVNDMLRGLTDEDIRAHEREVHDKLKAFAKGDGENSLSILVFDRNARALVSATVFPVSGEQRMDRDFNLVLRDLDAPQPAVSPLYSSPINGQRYFAVSRRRDGTANAVPRGSYDGVVAVLVYLDPANDALKRLLDAEGDVVTLLRSDGYVLARSAGLDGADVPVSIRPSGPIARALADGAARFSAVGAASLDGTERLFAARRVTGWPVYALAARPTSEIAAAWRQSMVLQLLIGIPAWLALVSLAWLVRRSQAELERRVEERTAGLAAAATALREGEQRLRLAHEAAGIGYWDHDMTTGATDWSPEMYALYGLDPARDGPMSHDRYFREIVHADDRERVVQAAQQAIESGRYECEYRVWRKRPDGGREMRWVVGRGRVMKAADGSNRRLLGANVDITERRAAEEQEAMLMREVDHRAKNVLAVVLSLLRLTRREGGANYATSVEGRVAAMGRVHTLLAENRWAGADLKEVVDAELGVYALPQAGREARVRVAGPTVQLAPQVAQAMSVVLHELATNAVKYGALSAPDGFVTVDWRLDDEGTLTLEWRERGGPPVAGAPQHQGFGSRLLDTTVRGQLGGKLDCNWAPEGLHCILTAPELARPSARAVSAAD